MRLSDLIARTAQLTREKNTVESALESQRKLMLAIEETLLDGMVSSREDVMPAVQKIAAERAKMLAVCEAAGALLSDMERGGMYGPLMDALRAALRDLEEV